MSRPDSAVRRAVCPRATADGPPARVVDRDAELLCHVQRGFVMHVLVQQCEAKEIQCVVVLLCPFEQRDHGIELGLQVIERGGCVRQRKPRSQGMRHAARIEQRIGIGAGGRQPCDVWIGAQAERALRVARCPPGLEPSDVSQLPQRRVQGFVKRNAQVRKGAPVIGETRQRVGAAVPQGLNQQRPAAAARAGR
jgi:hypothetical protein